jgi:RNA polymerase sigma factor FliA
MHATALTLESTSRDALICEHLDMARRIARKTLRRLPSSVRLDDLESAAMLGLTEAATRFDPTRGEPFVAFAAKRVRGAILDDLRRQDVLTRRGRERARELDAATRAVEDRTGRAATTEEVAGELGCSAEEVSRRRGRLQAANVVALDDVAELTAPASELGADALIEQRERQEEMVAALEALPQRELLILSMYFQDGLTLKEIGDILGVSESRVCQLRGRALRTLRKRMAP